MGIKMVTPLMKILKYGNTAAEIIDNMYIEGLQYFGETCVKFIRDRSAAESWFDHSGNLRSSIGYIIHKNGNVIDLGGFFPTNAPQGNGSEGVLSGKEYAKTLVKFVSGVFVLSIVAGMNYAEYVEARDNKDVLAQCELWAKEEWPKREKALKIKIKDALKSVGLR